MADEADRCEEIEGVHIEACIKRVQQAAACIPKGVPGDCRCCGEHSERLVGGACAPCRDRRGLP